MRIFLALIAVLLAFVSFWPRPDMVAAGLFYDAARGGFWWREMMAANIVHEAVQYGARVLVLVLAVTAITMPAYRKAALFLLVALLLGPGLLTNTVLKDNWGRARPVQVQEFGGQAQYTLALQPADQCERNCSFISGDGALGFYLHTFFYVVPPRWRRRAFWLGWAGGGAVFGGLRVAMGAHFLSDVLWAGALMLLASAVIHAFFYGKDATLARWRELRGG